MNILTRSWHPIWIILAMLAGVSGLMALEINEEPNMTPGQILKELAEPVFIVFSVVGVIHLLGRMNRQHREQLTLMRDLETARTEGAHWRADMRELLKGLSTAIDAQFERWQLTTAEREIALLMLKGLSHKEIAVVRNTQERTIRQQAQSIYGKANLSGRAALSAFFLEDLLTPQP
jgi:DNA-binding CsgD family transcriptional regulator